MKIPNYCFMVGCFRWKSLFLHRSTIQDTPILVRPQIWPQKSYSLSQTPSKTTQKWQKSRFLRILVMKLSVHWSWCHLFVMYSLKPIFWYQNYDFLALHLNFMRQNRPKMEPKMTPEPFIFDFSYQIANILAPLCL